MLKNFQTVPIIALEMPKKKQRSQASSFLDEESGDSSPRFPSPAPQLPRSHHPISPVNSRVSVGSSAVTTTSVEPRSGSASSGHLILTLEGQNNRDHLTFGLTLPPLPLRLITKNSSLIKDQPSKSLFFYSDLVSYRQL